MLRNGRVMDCNLSSAQSIEKWLSSWLIDILHALLGILQCCRVTVVTAQAKPKPQLSQIRLGLELGRSNHAKFQLNPIRNG